MPYVRSNYSISNTHSLYFTLYLDSRPATAPQRPNAQLDRACAHFIVHSYIHTVNNRSKTEHILIIVGLDDTLVDYD